MAKPKDEKRIQPNDDSEDRTQESDKRVPDVIDGKNPIEAFDLPRAGTEKDVVSVEKTSFRLPDVLIEE